jgi:hypothetical protein
MACSPFKGGTGALIAGASAHPYPYMPESLPRYAIFHLNFRAALLQLETRIGHGLYRHGALASQFVKTRQTVPVSHTLSNDDKVWSIIRAEEFIRVARMMDGNTGG